MSSISYIISVCTKDQNKKQAALQHIFNQLTEDGVIDGEYTVTVINRSDFYELCKKNTHLYGKTWKNDCKTSEIVCEFCNKQIKFGQFIFQFNECKHICHKKCLSYNLSNIRNDICSKCGNSYIPDISSI